MKKVVVILACCFLFLVSPLYSSAQCAMCRRVAQTNYEQQKTSERKGRSLNNGILYLLSMPYLIGVVGAFVWYKNRKKE